MNKKIIAQLSLILLIIIISFFFFDKYFNKNKKISNQKTLSNNIDDKVTKKINPKNNKITEIKYTSYDNQGNEYEITSQFGEIDTVNPDLIFMEKVKAKITLENYTPIIIIADYAMYNNVTFETKFSKNVLLSYLKSNAKSEYLDLSFESKIASMTKNIVLTDEYTRLEADGMIVDLITNDSKIFMNEKNKKIKLTRKK